VSTGRLGGARQNTTCDAAPQLITQRFVRDLKFAH